MNVLKAQMGALRFAQTLLEITHALVPLGIVWQVMDKHAMVNSLGSRLILIFDVI